MHKHIYSPEILKVRDDGEDVHWRIILKRILEEECGRGWIELNWLIRGLSDGLL
jgi:hypothetical protein